MFYCNKCAEERGYPESIGKSRGKCEICGEITDCNDVPSNFLPPLPKPELTVLDVIKDIPQQPQVQYDLQLQ